MNIVFEKSDFEIAMIFDDNQRGRQLACKNALGTVFPEITIIEKTSYEDMGKYLGDHEKELEGKTGIFFIDIMVRRAEGDDVFHVADYPFSLRFLNTIGTGPDKLNMKGYVFLLSEGYVQNTASAETERDQFYDTCLKYLIFNRHFYLVPPFKYEQSSFNDKFQSIIEERLHRIKEGLEIEDHIINELHNIDILLSKVSSIQDLTYLKPRFLVWDSYLKTRFSQQESNFHKYFGRIEISLKNNQWPADTAALTDYVKTVLAKL